MDDKTNYGAFSIVMLILSWGTLAGGWYLLFSPTCDLSLTFAQSIQIMVIFILVSLLFWMISLYQAGAGIATKSGETLAKISAMLSFLPVIIILCFYVVSLMYPEIWGMVFTPSSPDQNTGQLLPIPSSC